MPIKTASKQRDPEARRLRDAGRRNANATPPMIGHIDDELKPQPVAHIQSGANRNAQT